jgi:hypothetical protein
VRKTGDPTVFLGGFLLFWFNTHGWLLVSRLFLCFARWNETGLAIHEGDDWVMHEGCILDGRGRKWSLTVDGA